MKFKLHQKKNKGRVKRSKVLEKMRKESPAEYDEGTGRVKLGRTYVKLQKKRRISIAETYVTLLEQGAASAADFDELALGDEIDSPGGDLE